MKRVFLALRNLEYKYFHSIKPGNQLTLSPSCERLMKRATIKLGGRNNHLVLGKAAYLRNCEICLDGEYSLIVIGFGVRFKAGKIFLRHTRDRYILIGDKHSVLDMQTGERASHGSCICIADCAWIVRGSYLLKGTRKPCLWPGVPSSKATAWLLG